MNAEKNIPWFPRRFPSRRNLIAALIAVTLLSTRAAWADGDIAKQIKFEYLEKVLTLRHFYSGDHLSFRSDGTLQGDAPIGPWTLDGQIEVEDVHLRGAKLAIKGRRIHRIFDAQRNPQDQLSIIGNHPDKQHKDLEKALRSLRVEVQIDLPSDQPDEKDVTSAIHAVFLNNSESMMDIVPSYWRAYFAKQEGKPQSAPTLKEPAYPLKPGSGVSPPRATYQPDPEYSDEARKAKYQGTVVMSLRVDSSGAPTDLQLTVPLGLGLDEKAIAAVSTWQFKPALKDGEPVPITLHVEVSFRLY